MLFHFEFIINHDYYAIFLQAQELWDRLFMVISSSYINISPQTYVPSLSILEASPNLDNFTVLMANISQTKKTFKLEKMHLTKICLSIGGKSRPVSLCFLVLLSLEPSISLLATLDNLLGQNSFVLRVLRI